MRARPAPGAADPARDVAGERPAPLAAAAVRRAVRAPGRPLPADLRAQLARRFRFDFSQVPLRAGERLADAAEHAPEAGPERPAAAARLARLRVHDTAAAGVSSALLGARAYSVGRHLVAPPGALRGDRPAGRALLAHEAAHALHRERAPGGGDGPQRAVTEEYEQIRRRLSYRVFLDWVITDREAREVLDLLRDLSDRDLADTVAAMDRDGLLERLLDNLADEDRERDAVLIARLTRRRSVTRSAQRIEDLLSRGLFDWAITDDDARRALDVLLGLEPQQLRTMVARLVNEGVLDTLFEQLPREDQERYAAFLERVRDIRREFTSLVAQHAAYLRGRPGGAGRTVRRTVERTGYGGGRSDWGDLDEASQEDWRRRAREAVAAVRRSARGSELHEILVRSELRFVPEDVDRLNAYAYVQGENTLFFGRSWVEDVEENPVNVWQSIAHELGGHEEFGSTWSWEIMRATLRSLTPEERREALGSANSLFSAYGYLETEIYAELREFPHRIATSGGDRPETRGERPGDVRRQLTRLHRAFGPEVGRQIALRLYYRTLDDPRVGEGARRLLYREIQAVFSLFPIAEPIAP